MTDQLARCPGYDATKVDLEDRSILDHVAVCTDLDWHLNPMHPHLMCGGCGNEAKDCHPGVCCSEERDRMNMIESVCGYCRTRYETGQILHLKEVVA